MGEKAKDTPWIWECPEDEAGMCNGYDIDVTNTVLTSPAAL
jgi:hypothetical protein